MGKMMARFVSTLLYCMVLVYQVKCSCEVYSDSELIYNEEKGEMEVYCSHDEFILKSGESRETSDCKMCSCSDTGLQCCRTDQHVGVMRLSEECEVITDTSTGPCGYRMVRKDDNTIDC